MPERNHDSRVASRRRFVAASAAAVLGGPSLALAAASRRPQPGRFRRKNLADPSAARDLASYQRAITKMLSLSPNDPRNWFRNAIVHLLDCPHGNWWFLPWHRGYLGWFEMTCRDLSGDPEFALPYWDWTANPRLPASFLEGNFNPANFPIKSVAQFRQEFAAPLNDFWAGLNPDQLAQLQLRGMNSIDDVWKLIEGQADPSDTAPMFPEPADARALNPPHSQEFDETTNKAVSLSTILDALGPRDFIGFGSGKQANHHEPTTTRPVFGVLEAQPHNLVHNLVGGYIQGNPSRQGFMSAFLSPSDPIFFMHHANIDRLWDVWTRKQLSRTPRAQYPTAPVDADLSVWNSEPFLFYIGPDGKPTAKKQSGDFVSTDAFNYDYQPGSGEIVVTPTPRPMLANRAFASAVSGTKAVAPVPNGLPAAAGVDGGVRVVATITAELPHNARALRLNVILNPADGTRSVSLRDPGFAGSFELFGGHGHGRGAAGANHQASTVTFSVGLTDAIKRLSGTPRLMAEAPLDIRVIADTSGLELAPIEVKVIDVVVKTF